MIQAQDVEDYLHQHIPLSIAMGVRVHAATPERIALRAPLAPNINHEATVFGGSASAVAILAAWALVYLRLRSSGMHGRIVIHANTMLYQKPIKGDFDAIATTAGPEAWSKLFKAIARKRMARITIGSVLECAGEQVGALEGEFVVLPEDS